MTESRQHALEEVGFLWNSNNPWEERFNELKEFKDLHGHCRVPYRYAKNMELGRWVSHQRQNYKYLREGKPSKISQERVEALEDIGFDWSVDRLKQQSSNKKIDCPSSNNKRQEKKNERVLRSLKNIEIAVSFNNAWDERYKQLIEFKNKYGHCRVPARYDEIPELGRWVSHQRQNYKAYKDGRITSKKSLERIKQLQDIQFDWSVGQQGGKMNDRTWKIHYESLKRFRDEHEHCKVTQGYKDDPKLASWVSRQRQNYKLMVCGKPSKMTTERMHALEEIGFVWDVRTEPVKDSYYLISNSD